MVIYPIDSLSSSLNNCVSVEKGTECEMFHYLPISWILHAYQISKSGRVVRTCLFNVETFC